MNSSKIINYWKVDYSTAVNDLPDFVQAAIRDHRISVNSADSSAKYVVTTLVGKQVLHNGDYLYEAEEGLLYPCREDIIKEYFPEFAY